MKRGIATMPLDTGRCPRWLFARMTKLSREMIDVLVAEYGPEEFIKRIADPVWFQSMGTVLAFDWNSSGLTTILTAALKEAIRGREKDLGIFICGGKGKTSLKTPDEIMSWGERLGISEENTKALVYNSKMAAKIDSSLIQDSYSIYHHTFFFSQKGTWAVVQQGMNLFSKTARRYHWFSENIKDLIEEPHTGIISQRKEKLVLNLSAKESKKNRNFSRELVLGNYNSLIKDIQLLDKYSSKLSKMIRFKIKNQEITFLSLEDREFYYHPVLKEKFSQSPYLKKILWKLSQLKPKTYEELLAIPGVGPKTIRALSLVAEIIYGAKPSWQDPARYSFAHGGKDSTPYPVDPLTYDETIEILKKISEKKVKKIFNY
jgi:hypothetical protein